MCFRALHYATGMEFKKKQNHAVTRKNTLRWCISGAVFAAISTCGMKEKERKG